MFILSQNIMSYSPLLVPMWNWYINKCVESIINFNNGIQESSHGYQNCKTCQIVIFGGFVTMREYYHTRVLIRVNTILNHIDTSVILESSCMVYRPKRHQKRKYHQICMPIPIQKGWTPHYKYPNALYDQSNTVQHWSVRSWTNIHSQWLQTIGHHWCLQIINTMPCKGWNNYAPKIIFL